MKFITKLFDQLSLDELYEIIKLREQVFVVEQNCPYLECDGYDKKAVHLYAAIGAAIAAYTRILPPGLHYQEVSFGRVLVNEKYRRKGFAEKLLKECLNCIEEKYPKTNIKISAQTYLVEFYRRFGFEIISDEYLEDNIPHVNMLKKVNS